MGAGITWDAEPHTLVKHQVYERYLGKWMPIMIQGWKGDITYAEGFAGPGSIAAVSPDPRSWRCGRSFEIPHSVPVRET